MTGSALYKYNSLNDFLFASDEILCLDGGLGTELEARGINVNSSLWSSVVLINNPQAIIDLHYDYFALGASVAITCSYQASADLLFDYGQKHDGYSHTHSHGNGNGVCGSKNLINRKAIYQTEEQRKEFFEQCVEVAKTSRDKIIRETEQRNQQLANSNSSLDSTSSTSSPPLVIKPLISGSVGPYGAFLCDGSEFSGAYNKSIDFYKEFHRERVSFFLSHPDVDILNIETIPQFGEVKAIVSLIEDDLIPQMQTESGSSSNKKEFKYMLSFSIRDPVHLADGTPISKVVEYLNTKTNAFTNKHLVAIGGNCLKLRFSTDFLQNLQQFVPKGFPLVMYPNSGEIYDGVKKDWHVDPELKNDVKYEWENVVLEWIKYGARIVGGCCRVGTADIERISKTVQNYNDSIQK